MKRATEAALTAVIAVVILGSFSVTYYATARLGCWVLHCAGVTVPNYLQPAIPALGCAVLFATIAPCDVVNEQVKRWRK